MKVLYSEFLTTLWEEKQFVIVFEGLSVLGLLHLCEKELELTKAEDQCCHCRKFLQPNRPQNLWKGHFIATVFCFVCFPAALCSDNLPRCPTFLIAGSFNHSTRKWISEMWWRPMAPLIACLTSHVLPKCVNQPNTFINALWRGLNLCEKIVFEQTGAVCAVTGNVGGTLTVPCPTHHGLCHHVTPLTLSTHTHRWWPDLIMCHTCDFLGGGLWELGRTRVAGEGQQTVSNSRPWWEMLGLRRRVAPRSGFFLDVCAAYYANNTWESKIWRKGDYCELNCFILL